MPIDPASGRPLYRQLADLLRTRIVSGRWEPGTSLPSETSIGHEHEVGQATVRRALNVLRAEGYVETVRGMPWRVRGRREPEMVPLQPGDRVRARLSTHEDHEQHGIPEGLVVWTVVGREGDERVYRADEHEGEVSGDTPPDT
jgi:DNA-binding transcriptional regulator YhcF (GntR family)